MDLLHDTDTAVDQYRALLEVSESIALNRDLPVLFQDLAQRLHRVVRFEYLNLVLYVPERNTMRLRVLTATSPVEPYFLETAVEETPSGLVWQTQQPLVIHDIDAETRYPKITQFLRAHSVRSICVLPLTTAQQRLGAMGLGSADVSAYDCADLEFLQQVARQVAVAVENVLNYESAQSYQQQLARERDPNGGGHVPPAPTGGSPPTGGGSPPSGGGAHGGGQGGGGVDSGGPDVGQGP